jgi:hypothetical protein
MGICVHGEIMGICVHGEIKGLEIKSWKEKSRKELIGRNPLRRGKSAWDCSAS